MQPVLNATYVKSSFHFNEESKSGIVVVAIDHSLVVVFLPQASGLFHYKAELIPGLSFCPMTDYFMVGIISPLPGGVMLFFGWRLPLRLYLGVGVTGSSDSHWMDPGWNFSVASANVIWLMNFDICLKLNCFLGNLNCEQYVFVLFTCRFRWMRRHCPNIILRIAFVLLTCRFTSTRRHCPTPWTTLYFLPPHLSSGSSWLLCSVFTWASRTQ